MENLAQKSPFIIGFDGTNLGKSLEKHLLEMNPAGVIFFKRNIESLEQTSLLIKNIRDLLGDIIIAVDHEGGIVNRFPADCPVPPSPSALAYANSLDTVREACRMQAELMVHLGFNMNFVPLVDLALFSENQVIGTRAFCDDPERVVQYSQICIEEHDRLRVGTTVKHFPTHGRTITDSHYAVGQVIHESQAQLEKDLKPYGNAIGSGVSAVMTAHLSYPLLDSEFPASLSRKILFELLQEKLGFKGLIISDCVEMEGLSKNYPRETIIKKGLDAGVDLFISSFSLKRSREFQLDLKTAYDKASCANPDIVQKLQSKIASFFKSYSLFLRTQTNLPTLDSAIVLHKKTLEKRIIRHKTTTNVSYHLVELQNSANRGINADTRWNAAADGILAHSDRVVDKTIISFQDTEKLNRIIEACNSSGTTLLMLTANGKLSKKFKSFIKILKAAKSSIHIALLHPADLCGICDQEWATRGYNACTGKMLAIELDA
ncbi:MAG: hypothetical protein MJE63_18725 [Proteobacteria bacterium]|nr:hypothetical protein [Pseudomonadota bacterium]